MKEQIEVVDCIDRRCFTNAISYTGFSYTIILNQIQIWFKATIVHRRCYDRPISPIISKYLEKVISLHFDCPIRNRNGLITFSEEVTSKIPYFTFVLYKSFN